MKLLEFKLLKSISIALFLCTAMLFMVCSSSNKAIVTTPADTSDLEMIKSFQANLKKIGIKNYGEWQTLIDSPKKLYYFVKSQVQDDKTDVEVLNIHDENGKLIYQDTAGSFEGIEIFDILRQKGNQMIIKQVNYGGSGSFFQILDYKNGKVVSVTNEDDALYSGELTIIPQYHEEKYYSLPYQVFLSQYLVSKDAPATVLRYVGDKYVSVGTLNQKNIGNALIKENVIK